VLYEHSNYFTKHIVFSYSIFEKNFNNTAVIKMGVSNEIKKINYNKLFLLYVATYAVLDIFLIFAFRENKKLVSLYGLVNSPHTTLKPAFFTASICLLICLHLGKRQKV